MRLTGPGPVPLAEQFGALFEMQQEGKILRVVLGTV